MGGYRILQRSVIKLSTLRKEAPGVDAIVGVFIDENLQRAADLILNIAWGDDFLGFEKSFNQNLILDFALDVNHDNDDGEEANGDKDNECV